MQHELRESSINPPPMTALLSHFTALPVGIIWSIYSAKIFNNLFVHVQIPAAHTTLANIINLITSSSDRLQTQKPVADLDMSIGQS